MNTKEPLYYSKEVYDVFSSYFHISIDNFILTESKLTAFNIAYRLFTDLYKINWFLYEKSICSKFPYVYKNKIINTYKSFIGFNRYGSFNIADTDFLNKNNLLFVYLMFSDNMYHDIHFADKMKYNRDSKFIIDSSFCLSIPGYTLDPRTIYIGNFKNSILNKYNINNLSYIIFNPFYRDKVISLEKELSTDYSCFDGDFIKDFNNENSKYGKKIRKFHKRIFSCNSINHQFREDGIMDTLHPTYVIINKTRSPNYEKFKNKIGEDYKSFWYKNLLNFNQQEELIRSENKDLIKAMIKYYRVW